MKTNKTLTKDLGRQLCLNRHIDYLLLPPFEIRNGIDFTSAFKHRFILTGEGGGSCTYEPDTVAGASTYLDHLPQFIT